MRVAARLRRVQRHQALLLKTMRIERGSQNDCVPARLARPALGIGNEPLVHCDSCVPSAAT
ncbi:hypothetical protein [Xanthomonas oryzae]|uniref:hypothetical protein n=1 Tax=Xanthomonas oryzae TaxID=347 RepID=UPI0014043565|nr:hypothetical protein [Xanthomonas oryzae]